MEKDLLAPPKRVSTYTRNRKQANGKQVVATEEQGSVHSRAVGYKTGSQTKGPQRSTPKQGFLQKSTAPLGILDQLIPISNKPLSKEDFDTPNVRPIKSPPPTNQVNLNNHLNQPNFTEQPPKTENKTVTGNSEFATCQKSESKPIRKRQYNRNKSKDAQCLDSDKNLGASNQVSDQQKLQKTHSADVHHKNQSEPQACPVRVWSSFLPILKQDRQPVVTSSAPVSHPMKPGQTPVTMSSTPVNNPMKQGQPPVMMSSAPANNPMKSGQPPVMVSSAPVNHSMNPGQPPAMMSSVPVNQPFKSGQETVVPVNCHLKPEQQGVQISPAHDAQATPVNVSSKPESQFGSGGKMNDRMSTPHQHHMYQAPIHMRGELFNKRHTVRCVNTVPMCSALLVIS